MGRKKSIAIRKYFEEDKIKNAQICIINNCNKHLSGNNITNLERHIKNIHPDFYTKIILDIDDNAKKRKTDKKNIYVNTSETTIWEGCLEMVSAGLPFSFITNNGFQKIIKPMTTKLEIQNEFNVPNLKNKISETSSNIRKQIKDDINNKLVSLKIDSVTRHCRSLLGINVQYIKNNSINIRTLGIREMKERHTAEYIKILIIHVLQEYNISLNQIYTITSDNGKNMIKSKNLLKDDLKELMNVDEDDVEFVEDEILKNLEEMENLMTHDTLINCIRCAAHTLQLVVYDAIKEENLAKLISEARRLAVALRKPINFSKIMTQNLRKPILNIPTRWNSAYDMMLRLIDLKEFCNNNKSDDTELYMKDDDWRLVSEFINVFKPLKVTTLLLQENQMVFGDFYKLWLQLKVDITKMASPLAEKILEIIKKREVVLLSNNVLLSAIYLDPRFNFIMTPCERIKAHNHLKQLFNHLKSMENIKLDTDHTSNSNASFSSAEGDDITNYLNNIENQQKNSNSNPRTTAYTEIVNYSPERMRDHSINIIKYWNLQSENYPNLHALAKIVHAVPATQVSVERSFSALKLILSDERNRLSSENLENILMMRLNYGFE